MSERAIDPRASGREAARYVARYPCAWPGGYRLVLVMSDGAVLCHDCVRSKGFES